MFIALASHYDKAIMAFDKLPVVHTTIHKLLLLSRCHFHEELLQHQGTISLMLLRARKPDFSL